MSTFADPAIRALVRQRMERLTPNSTRQWGRMTPHQMVCHLTDAYRMALGERNPAAVDNLLSRTAMKWYALHTNMPWPKGVSTVPEADQYKQGTKPVAWEPDHLRLLSIVDRFMPTEGHRHPIFGPLSANEWNIWAFRHADHHLRQFSL